MNRDRYWQPLVDGTRRGDRRAVSQLISFVENRGTGWRDAMEAVFPLTGHAAIIGITGSPGAGKSTLTGRLAKIFADRGRKVAVVAVDPSSPFSGGAILGDRIRMNDLPRSGIFMRSMATRGATGGLAQATRDAARILDAAGFDLVLIETVGVGQDETDVMRAAQLTVVVCAPGQGDVLQATKAGLMEIADVFVVNKADRDGADQLVADIKAMRRLAERAHQPVPELLKTTATTGAGVLDVSATVERLLAARPPRRSELRASIEAEVTALAEAAWRELLWVRLGMRERLARRLDASDRADPYAIAGELGSIEALRVAVRNDDRGGN